MGEYYSYLQKLGENKVELEKNGGRNGGKNRVWGWVGDALV